MLQACRLKTCQARWANLSVLPSQTWSRVQCVLVLCFYGIALAVLLLCCISCAVLHAAEMQAQDLPSEMGSSINSIFSV